MADLNWMRTYVMKVTGDGSTFKIGNTSSSDENTLHINFEIEKANTENPNTAKVQVWNLSPDNLKILEGKKVKLALAAGYSSVNPVILTGDVTNVTTTIDGADRCTEIEVNDGKFALSNTRFSIAIKEKVNSKTLYQKIAKKMGVTVVFAKGLKYKTFKHGFSFVGKAKDALKKIAKKNGHIWTIQDGILQITVKRKPVKDKVYLISESTGLIGEPTKTSVGESNSSVTGLEIQYFLNGAVGVNNMVHLKSKKYDASYIVYKVSMSGDNQSGDWVCKAQILTPAAKKKLDALIAAEKAKGSSSGSDSSDGYSFVEGKKYPAVFTSYGIYYHNPKHKSWTQGSYGRNYAYKTLAGPTIFGGKYVKIEGTGTKWDGKVVHVSDSGKGADGNYFHKENGRWHFDVCEKTWNEAAAFGRHNGTITVMKKVKSSSGGSGQGTGKLGWPCRGTITCNFGQKRSWDPYSKAHTGMDIAVSYGTEIKAADSGTVILAGTYGGFGNCVQINHGWCTTLYGHNSKLCVSKGQHVKKGQVIAKAGSTGFSNGVHCHFQLSINGHLANPRKYLK